MNGDYRSTQVNELQLKGYNCITQWNFDYFSVQVNKLNVDNWVVSGFYFIAYFT